MGTNNRNYKEYGYIDFSKLWEVMKRKGHNKQYLLNNGIHKTTLYKLVNNKNVTCEVIAKLCYILTTQPKNIMEYKPPAVHDQTQPEATQSHTEPPENAQTVKQSAPDTEEPPHLDTLPEELPPLDWSQLPDDLNDMTPEQAEIIRRRCEARKAQETPPDPIPPEDLPFH